MKLSFPSEPQSAASGGMYANAALFMGFLATFARALPASSVVDPGYQISQLETHEIQGSDTALRFKVLDMDPMTNETAVCLWVWQTGSRRYPTGSYVSIALHLHLCVVLSVGKEPCGKSNFAWKMDSFGNIGHFVLAINHEFEDPR